MQNVTLPAGDRVPALGQGTWELERSERGEAVKAVQLGLDLGMTLIDTAEMYGEGKVEEIVGEAIKGRREEVFLVTKAYPWHGTRAGLADAAARSLKRLKTDRIDVYLLHWRGDVPLTETVEGMEALRQKGQIRGWGVSNFDTADMEELVGLPDGEEGRIDSCLQVAPHVSPDLRHGAADDEVADHLVGNGGDRRLAIPARPGLPHRARALHLGPATRGRRGRRGHSDSPRPDGAPRGPRPGSADRH